MISAQHNSTVGREGPMTHRAYTAFSVSRALSSLAFTPIHVQIRRRGEMICGTVAEMVEDFNESAQEWFKVDCALGRVWVESKKIRLCSGDGRCACEGPCMFTRPQGRWARFCHVYDGGYVVSARCEA